MAFGKGAIAGVRRSEMTSRREKSIWRYIWILVILLFIVSVSGTYFKEYFERLDPEYYTKHFQMGGYYLKEGVFDLASREFQKAVKARAESVDGHYGLAIAYLRQGKLEEASHSFEKALEIAPGHPDIRYFLGNTYQRMGKLERALEEYRVLIEKGSDSYEVFNNMGMIHLKLGNRDKALQAFEQAQQRLAKLKK
ncbi:MAG TPA: tetratricopeptide repeat protein [Geobacteraceae bacterium]|nr:tetratricopeptide repeat protein [Geobacteraceae bacterium]